MAARKKSKPQPSARSQSKAKKTGNSKSRVKSKGKAGKRPKARAKTKKKTSASRRNDTLWARIRFNLLFLALGVAAGVLVAVLILYFLGVFSTSFKWNPPFNLSSETSKSSQSKYAAAGGKYEENNRLDRHIKMVDQALYRVLALHKVPEKNIHFIQLTRKRVKKSEWNHATIAVSLPPDVQTDKLIKDMQAAVSRLSLDPPPHILVSRQDQTTRMKVLFNGLLTHTLLFKVAAAKAAPAPLPALPPAKPRPKVAIVIDDLGMNKEHDKCFLSLNMPLAMAVLPFQVHSRDVAREAHKRGRTVMLHLPMEPAQYPLVLPGEGALLMSMNREEITARVREAIKAVPFIAGVNNHMGSRFTEDSERMGWVLEEIKKQGLFFLDSRTSARTRAYATARHLGVKTAERAVFLDNVQETEAIRIQIKRLIALARQHGQAVAIGHPYPITCKVLKMEYNYLKSNVELVAITRLLK